MKKIIALTLTALLIGTGAEAKSTKRGVSENNFMFSSQLEKLSEGVTWYYNWGNTPGAGYKNQVADCDALEYVPMAWNGNYNADKIREYCRSHPNTKYILGFNEPNFKAQANMTPQQAAEAWPALRALADELNLKLVAPALNYSPDAPYNDPLKWMDEFVALVGKDAFDYTAVHNYGGLGVMKTIAGNFHDRYGKDVWVTEFCYWPGEGSGSYVNPVNQISSMIETVEWLEQTDWIFRYAWFKATGNSSASTGPNYGLLIAPTPVTEPWTLSDQGVVYTYMPEYDFSKVNPINEYVNAIDYIRSHNVILGSGDDELVTNPLHITGFTGGASVDYRFNVPEAGDYTLTLRVAGFGEPVRFDPELRFLTVNEEGDEIKELLKTGTFSLPNEDSDYVTLNFPVSLEKGEQIIRISDDNIYRPSGIRISAVRLSDTTGIEGVLINGDNEPGNVYNLQGMMVMRSANTAEDLKQLPAGIYIVKGKKVIVK